MGSRKLMSETSSKIIETVKFHNKINKVYKSSFLDNLCGEERYDGVEYGFKEKIQREKDAIHCCLHGHPLEAVRAVIKGYETIITDLSNKNNDEEVQILCQINDVKKITTKKCDTMAFVKIEDEYSSCAAILFPKAYEALKELIKEDELLILSGNLQLKEDKGQNSLSIIINTAKKALDNALRFYIDKNDLNQIESELIQYNGIAEIIEVDSKNLSVKKKDYCVDYTKALEILMQNQFEYLV